MIIGTRAKSDDGEKSAKVNLSDCIHRNASARKPAGILLHGVEVEVCWDSSSIAVGDGRFRLGHSVTMRVDCLRRRDGSLDANHNSLN